MLICWKVSEHKTGFNRSPLIKAAAAMCSELDDRRSRKAALYPGAIQCANHAELAGRKKEAGGSEQRLYCYGGTLGFYKDSALLVCSSSLSSPPALFSLFSSGEFLHVTHLQLSSISPEMLLLFSLSRSRSSSAQSTKLGKETPGRHKKQTQKEKILISRERE